MQYGLNKLVHNGNVYVRNDKVWYGLKKVGKLANVDMVALLETHGYIQCKHTNGLFTHKEHWISFMLVVDNFEIKDQHQSDLDHLMSAMETKYSMLLDVKVKHYVGIDLIVIINWKSWCVQWMGTLRRD